MGDPCPAPPWLVLSVGVLGVLTGCLGGTEPTGGGYDERTVPSQGTTVVPFAVAATGSLSLELEIEAGLPLVVCFHERGQLASGAPGPVNETLGCFEGSRASGASLSVTPGDYSMSLSCLARQPCPVSFTLELPREDTGPLPGV